MSSWTYEGQPFTSDMISDNVGFVYQITNLQNGKKYIGKKWFWSTKKLPPLKGKKRKRTVKKESDWMKYFGSSEEVKLLVEQHGEDNFEREILRLCKTKGECTYYEAKLQFDFDVLLRDDYYNEFIGCKIHSKHLKIDYE
jgi:hypothetical protein|tara:strand:+ start:496 stop:915 length:420 start_codon:yes stop_codon:yes gene_type:complete